MRAFRLSLLTVASALAACSDQPKREITATVVDIAPPVSRWKFDEVLVTARSSNGLVGIKSVSMARLRCHIGDTVQASASGISLHLDDKACTK
jgi:hypothetical protein